MPRGGAESELREPRPRRGSRAAPAEARPRAARERPLLLFVSSARSGPARRMAGLVAWVRVTQKRRLQVVDVDADRYPAFVQRLRVKEVPALVLVSGQRVVARLEGRATGREIEQLIRPYLA